MPARGADLVVIGAGAAGVAAWHAAVAARPGGSILVLERRGRPLAKFRITGKGRCNLTNRIPPRLFLDRLGRRARFLSSALAAFGPEETCAFFESLGVPVKVERGERVFPVSDSAVEAAGRFAAPLLASSPPAFVAGASVRALAPEGEGFRLDTSAGLFHARRVVAAPGGLTYPATGSDGSFYALLAGLGHTVVPPRHALCGMTASPGAARPELSGVALKNVAVRLLSAGKPAAEAFGELLFTHDGLSGPTVLHLSRDGRHLFADAGEAVGRVEVAIDLKPAIPEDELARRLDRDLADNPKRTLPHALGGILPQSLLAAVLAAAGADPGRRAGDLPRAARRAIVSTLKEWRMPVDRLDGPERAVITMGGVALGEIDPRTMESRLVPGLHLAGEVLDLDGPTGGFNLQIAFTTGFAAGRAAALRLG